MAPAGADLRLKDGVLLDLLVGPPGLALDVDEEAAVDEAVGDGGGGGGVVEELSPVLEGQVGGDDGGGALVAAIEDLVEQVGAAGVEAQVAQFVEQKELVRGPYPQPPVQAVARLRGDEVVDEIGGGGEADTMTTEASEQADGVRQVGLADARGAEEDTVGFVRQELQGCRLHHRVPVYALG